MKYADAYTAQPQDTKQAEENIPTPINTNFNVPLLVLKQILSEMTSIDKTQSGQKISHGITMRILKSLEKYSWEAKAMLTLAAFSMEFRDFSCPLSRQIHQSAADQDVAESLAIHTKMLFFTKSSEPEKFQPQVVNELKLIKDCMMTAVLVMEKILKLEKLSSVYDKESHTHELKTNSLMAYSYWIIMTVVTCATKIPTREEGENPQGFWKPYTDKIHEILGILETSLKHLTQKNEEAEQYWVTVQKSINPTDIADLLHPLLFGNRHIFDYSNRRWINTDPLRGKVGLLFVTNKMSLSGEDSRFMEAIKNKIDGEKNFQLVWIPVMDIIVSNYSEISNNTSNWSSGSKYASYCFPTARNVNTPAITYIKEEWHFKEKTMLVVMNERGIIENYDAIDLLRHWGMEAFPFNKVAEARILDKVNWPETLVSDLGVPDLKQWIKDEERHIFFYGGRDHEWIQKFEKTIQIVEKLATSSEIIKTSQFCVERSNTYDNESNGNNVYLKFWSGAEKILSATEANKNFDSETRQIQKLLSYKYQDGWVMICQGRRVVMCGQGETVLKALEEFNAKWDKRSSFEEYFLECYNYVIEQYGVPCCRVEIQGSYGKELEKMQCTECSNTLKPKITYECCHEGTPKATHR
ncbi:Sieve element occlusion [Trema orientale]|uniref:Sieve element occlusion n=1 Tax=Trema orientale TaxID=63057 RepID=A0A2P5ECP3_TREOI|nr:Sieve element occlusion [Trema orientale]